MYASNRLMNVTRISRWQLLVCASLSLSCHVCQSAHLHQSLYFILLVNNRILTIWQWKYCIERSERRQHRIDYAQNHQSNRPTDRPHFGSPDAFPASVRLSVHKRIRTIAWRGERREGREEDWIHCTVGYIPSFTKYYRQYQSAALPGIVLLQFL